MNVDYQKNRRDLDKILERLSTNKQKSMDLKERAKEKQFEEEQELKARESQAKKVRKEFPTKNDCDAK